MRMSQAVIVTLFTVAALMMSACARTGYQPAQSPSSYADTQYGVIESIEITPAEGGGIAGSGIGAGTVIGGVVGGVLGHQVGGGTGKDIATAAGVVGGAMLGHELEQRNQQQNVYRVRVRLNRGGSQTMTLRIINDLRVGDRVRIENGNLYRN